MSNIIAIDPGCEHSAVVRMRDGEVMWGSIESNDEILNMLATAGEAIDVIVIEKIASMGMPAGADLFETCVWTGRFIQAWGGDVVRIPRVQVKRALCGTHKANDATIRQSIIDRYGPTKEVAIGRKASPGPLYRIKSHMWQALAVGLTYLDQLQEAKSA